MTTVITKADWLSDGGIDEIPERDIPVDKSFPNSVFVSNIPIVDEKKLPKLEKVINNLFGVPGPFQLYMPINPAIGTTEGFAILTYEEVEAVDKAITSLNGMKLDAKHTFKAALQSVGLLIRHFSMTRCLGDVYRWVTSSHTTLFFPSRRPRRD